MIAADRPDGVPVRRSVLVDRARLSVLEAGQGGSVVLLHGAPTGAELWRGLLARLATAGYHALAPDLPGYGLTRLPPTADHSLTAAADLISRWLMERGAGPVWLVGHDIGGAVAQLLATQHPDVVARLTLVNSIVDGAWPAPRARVATLAAKLGLYRPAARLGIVPNWYLYRQVRHSCATSSAIADADLNRVVWDTKFSTPEGRAAFQRHLAALTPRDTASLPSALAQISVPCQLVWGMQDPFQSWDVSGARLQELLPSPVVARLPESGHLVPLEDPDGLVRVMLAWQHRAR